MSAYVIANIDVTDAEQYEGYRAQAGPSLAAYGGRFVVRGGRAEALEGRVQPKRVIVLEFPTFEQARAWWASAEYAGAKAIRQRSAITDLFIVEGI